MEGIYLYKEACGIYGKQKVDEVMSIVGISDADAAYSAYMDEEDEVGVAIVEMLYFDE